MLASAVTLHHYGLLRLTQAWAEGEWLHGAGAVEALTGILM